MSEDTMKRILIMAVLLCSIVTIVKGEEGKTTNRWQPQGGLKLEAGPMWTTSKVYTDYQGHFQTDIRGTGLSLSLSHLGNRVYGWSGDFYVNHTSVSLQSHRADDKTSYTIFYIGPSFVVGGCLVKRLRGEASAGVGLSLYNDDGQTETGFGFRYTLGLEYMLSRNIGIGIEGLGQTMFFKKPDNFKQPDGESYGFRHYGFMLGLRLYH